MSAYILIILLQVHTSVTCMQLLTKSLTFILTMLLSGECIFYILYNLRILFDTHNFSSSSLAYRIRRTPWPPIRGHKHHPTSLVVQRCYGITLCTYCTCSFSPDVLCISLLKASFIVDTISFITSIAQTSASPTRRTPWFVNEALTSEYMWYNLKIITKCRCLTEACLDTETGIPITRIGFQGLIILQP